MCICGNAIYVSPRTQVSNNYLQEFSKSFLRKKGQEVTNYEESHKKLKERISSLQLNIEALVKQQGRT